jgi:hypothetical protein
MSVLIHSIPEMSNLTQLHNWPDITCLGSDNILHDLARFLELIFGALLRTHFGALFCTHFWRAFVHTFLARFCAHVFCALFRAHF